MLRFVCPTCGVPLKAREEARGKSLTCPKCGNQLQVPTAASAEPDLPRRAAPKSDRATAGPNSATTRVSGLAIGGLVFGILGFLSFGIAGVAGLILSLVSLSKIRSNLGRLRGKALAIAGVVVSASSIVLAVPLLVLALTAFRMEVKNWVLHIWQTAKTGTELAQIPVLTRQDVLTAISEPCPPESEDIGRARRCRDLALDLYDRRSMKPGNLYRAISYFKLSLSYYGAKTEFEEPVIQKIFGEAVREACACIYQEYAEALVHEQAGSQDAALKSHGKVLGLVPDSDCVIHKHVLQRMRAIRGDSRDEVSDYIGNL